MIELTVTKTSENPSVFTLTPSAIEIGGKDSNLIDYIHVNIPEEWQGKVIRATFNQSALYGGNIIPKILNADGIIELKSDVTLCSGDLVIDAVGVDGSVSPSTGCHYTVYSHPKFGGTEQDVTPSEYQQFVADTKGYSDSAQANATATNASKEAAELSEQNAKSSETAAQTAQKAAENAKAAAQGSAEAAAQSETNSKNSETAAKTSETNSKTSETNSANSALAAAGSATAAETAASAAQAANIVNPQSWSDDQKSTARTNINVPSISDIDDLRAQFALYGDSVIGVQADFKNSVFTRLCGAKNLTAGAPFDKYHMFGGRKRCNVADNGTITAYYGDANYKEDGSNGQVMVYQPKFYYKVVPLALEPISNGIGYHLRKANYYISDNFVSGFKLHPAFYDANGHAVNYILCSAFEGSIFDTSANSYLLYDEQVMDNVADKFCSIAGAKPASGKTQNLTRSNLNQMCMNRGTGWYSDNIKATSANQMLMIVEMGMMNMETAIGQGVVSVADNPNTENNSKVTGGTSALGNGTGQATGTSGQVSVSYRGYENPWGNIWKLINGVNIWGDGTLGGGVPYYATDFNFAESKRTDNYVSAGFNCANAGGYISAIGYAPECDWMFIGSEVLGNSSVPVGDYQWTTANLNDYRIALQGGYWNNDTYAGAFYWHLGNGMGTRGSAFGGRLVYIPTAI